MVQSSFLGDSEVTNHLISISLDGIAHHNVNTNATKSIMESDISHDGW
jgi:hypothetical protein